MDDIIAKYSVGQPIQARVAVRNTLRTVPFIPPIPVSAVTRCVQLGIEDALPLILAVHRQLSMKKADRTPLNKHIWAAAGDPPERKRARILSLLRKAPDLIELQERKTSSSHYDVGYGHGWGA